MSSSRLFQTLSFPINSLFCLNKKFLVFNLVSRNLKIKYRRSVFGFFWTLLSPTAMAAVFYFVFKVVLNVSVPHYLAFIMSGILPWTFFSQSLMENMESIVGNFGLVSKVPIPLQVFPFSGTITNLITLILALPVIIGASLVSNVTLGPSLICVLFYCFILFLITYGLSFCLSVAFVYFRDLRHILNILLQIWFYATPVLYQETMIPEKYHFILYLNPMGPVLTGFHRILVHGDWPQLGEVLFPCGWALLILCVALIIQKYFIKEVVEQI